MVDLKINIPEHFLEKEVRCEYTISRQMKEVWAVCIDLLEEFKRVCRKYQLHYIADFGTLLGAIRHKGFIPWDDDLDVAMPREDYEKFGKICLYTLVTGSPPPVRGKEVNNLNNLDSFRITPACAGKS